MANCSHGRTSAPAVDTEADTEADRFIPNRRSMPIFTEAYAGRDGPSPGEPIASEP